ncbi:hypothetical protein DLAC_05021 [Tieghemostelium lacteum]|uniref:RBR-type E3 ubiquitin transferase n=1 Tax=Tieghemostelium lacteum TaxID=361077 RepID=A0A151ZI13_TIELA|nr:hypothetical protein DLAC_05021 [Tieghemostelium lacteum]|eukprot:KYQ93638.1 hypothetical protein DLAC_05021 [Tieghemostelium lacteum]
MDFDYDLQQQEIAVLKSIFADSFHQHSTKKVVEENGDEYYKADIRKSREEISYDPTNEDCYFQMKITLNLPEDFKVKVKRSDLVNNSISTTTTTTTSTTSRLSLGHAGHDEKKEDESEYIEYAIVSLPCLSLNFQYPQNYPQESAPLFQLSCSWLTIDQMERIVEHLDTLFDKGELVIFKYIDWVKDNALDYLGLGNELLLTNDPINSDFELIGSRAQWEHEYNWVSMLSVLPRILSHNSHESKRLFSLNSHTCPICYCDYPASEMTILQCNHFLCNECLSATCNINIQSKNIQLLKCTEPDCPQTFDINTIQHAASADNFAKYQDLVKLSKGYTKCTNCPNGWAFIDVHTQSTFCSNCYFSKCLMCTNGFHPGVYCEDVGRAPTPINKANLMVKRDKSNQKLKDKIQEFQAVKQEEWKNRNFMDRRCKPCPYCHMMIWKYDGCSKMACTNCSTKFCFICLKIIQDYSHFNTGTCQLFELETPVPVFTIPTKLIQEFTQQSNDCGAMKCLRCRSLIARYKFNNHLLCFSCKTEMCYQCKTIINSGTKHYTTSSCQQHGDPTPVATTTTTQPKTQ